MKIPDRFTTERLLIRRWKPGDVDSLREATSETERELKDWMPGFLSDLAKADEFLIEVETLFRQGKYFGYAITNNEEVLGAISLNIENENPEVSYWARTDCTGQGIATEALIALCDQVSSPGEFGTVQLRCDSSNFRSQRVAVKAGFFVHSEGRAPKRTEAQSGRELVYKRQR